MPRGGGGGWYPSLSLIQASDAETRLSDLSARRPEMRQKGFQDTHNPHDHPTLLLLASNR